MAGPGRPRSSVAGLTLLLAGLLAVPAPASGAVATAGTFPLPVDGENLTGWVTVLPGRSVHYQTSSDAYVSYWAEVEGRGTADGGDGGGMQGCLASDTEFRFRLGWANAQVLFARAANISFQIDLEFGTAGCTDLQEALRAHDTDNRAPPGFDSSLLTAGLLLSAALGASGVAAWFILSRQKRGGPPKGSLPPQGGQAPPPPRAEEGASALDGTRVVDPPK